MASYRIAEDMAEETVAQSVLASGDVIQGSSADLSIPDESKSTLNDESDSPARPIEVSATAVGTSDIADPSTSVKDLEAPSKDDWEDAESCDRKAAAAGEEKAEKKTAPEKDWISPAPLYCKRTGRSHANLLDFGVWTCPVCYEDLDPPKTLKSCRSLPTLTHQPTMTRALTRPKTRPRTSRGTRSKRKRRNLCLTSLSTCTLTAVLFTPRLGKDRLILPSLERAPSRPMDPTNLSSRSSRRCKRLCKTDTST